MKKYLLVLIFMWLPLIVSLSLLAVENGKIAQKLRVDIPCDFAREWKGSQQKGVKDATTLSAKIRAPTPALTDHQGPKARVTGKVDGKGG